MDLITFLSQSSDLSDVTCTEDFAARWKRARLNKGEQISHQGQSETDEYVVLAGRLVSSICDEKGKEVCVGFYVGPCVVTPNIARTRNGVSLVSIVATTDASLARIDSKKLSGLMITSQPIRDWANAVLRDSLREKGEREWCLAALGGAERLNWFRQTFPGYEAIFTHASIASFLGVTPVTLSRLRARESRGS
ncbi:Crp/Fnr family transcriptional regulator [uncultured Jannaschia sp.]|uniref:Crp/Fnr family transcriptional regulator n=1 Tax=uncultured Jannaschia sp. TaxID=293347 RepID=UPI00345D4B96